MPEYSLLIKKIPYLNDPEKEGPIIANTRGLLINLSENGWS